MTGFLRHSLVASRWTRRLAASLAAGVAVALAAVLLVELVGSRRLFARAEAAAQRGDHRLAAALYAEFAEREPDHRLAPEALLRLGRTSSVFLGDQDGAVRALRLAAARAGTGPEAVEAQRLIGEIFETRKGDCRQAIVEYQRLIGLDPDGPRSDEARLAVARCSFVLGDYGQARADFEQLLERGPGGELRARALLGLANCLLLGDRHAQALQRYRQAEAAAPSPALAAEAGFGVGASLEAAGELDAAREAYARVRATHPNPGVLEARIARIEDRIARRGARPAAPP